MTLKVITEKKIPWGGVQHFFKYIDTKNLSFVH